MIKIFRIIFIVVCLLLQTVFVTILLNDLIEEFPFGAFIYSVYCLFFILRIIKDSRNYSFTLPWIIIFLIIPVPGSILYIVIREQLKTDKLLINILRTENESSKYTNNSKIKYNGDRANINYFNSSTNFPVTTNNDAKYYPLGELGWKDMLLELKEAKNFIFMEYFIVEEGKMWNSILEILEEKVKNGVEVRVMYDDFGCLNTLKHGYYKRLEEKGIKCIPFNKLKAFGGVIMNNRDHRKITVIDGKVAFSGGINLADEYINEVQRFGHWKDNVFKIKGNAVWNYTVMFLTLWNGVKKEDKDFKKYKYTYKNNTHKGYVVPFCDNPFKPENLAEDVYINLINEAKNYLYIATPYLIIDTKIEESLKLAVKRGVDVRVIIPGIPDKKIVYTASESYSEGLIKSGVKVYKYEPGFIHAKVLVSDDKRATVGTINMDYRSLYLHFECGCYFEDNDVIKEIKDDMDDTLKKCHQITKKEATVGHVKSFWYSILRLFSPLM